MLTIPEVTTDEQRKVFLETTYQSRDLFFQHRNSFDISLQRLDKTIEYSPKVATLALGILSTISAIITGADDLSVNDNKAAMKSPIFAISTTAAVIGMGGYL